MSEAKKFDMKALGANLLGKQSIDGVSTLSIGRLVGAAVNMLATRSISVAIRNSVKPGYKPLISKKAGGNTLTVQGFVAAIKNRRTKEQNTYRV